MPDKAEVRMGSSRLAFLVSSQSHALQPQVLHLYNDTPDPVEVQSAEVKNDLSSILGVDGSQFFTVAGSQPTWPASLAPGERMTFTLTFLPDDDLTHLALFVVHTNHAEYSELRVSLLGKVYTDPRDPNF
jgi:hypothetical protein